MMSARQCERCIILFVSSDECGDRCYELQNTMSLLIVLKIITLHMKQKKIQKPAKKPISDDENESGMSEELPSPKMGKMKGSKGQEVDQPKIKKSRLFSQEFRGQVDKFRDFLSAYLKLKAKVVNIDADGEQPRIQNEIRAKIESQCSKVMEQDLAATKKCVQAEQATIRSNLANLENTMIQIRKSLEDIKTFSDFEINEQLKTIQCKKDEFLKNLNYLEGIRERMTLLHQPDPTTIQVMQ